MTADRRRVFLIIGGVLAGLFLAILVVIAAGGPEPRSGNGADETTPDATELSDNGGNDKTTHDATELSAAESELASTAGWIDPATCDPSAPADATTGATTSISCFGLGDGSGFTVYVEQFGTQAELDDHFDAEVSSAGARESDGDIRSEEGAAWDTWTLDESPDHIEGRVLFVPEYNDGPAIVWTENAALRVYTALADPPETEELKDWW